MYTIAANVMTLRTYDNSHVPNLKQHIHIILVVESHQYYTSNSGEKTSLNILNRY